MDLYTLYINSYTTQYNICVMYENEKYHLAIAERMVRLVTIKSQGIYIQFKIGYSVSNLLYFEYR